MGERISRGLITTAERTTYRALIEEAVSSGARKNAACECIGLNLRRFERWIKSEEDQRSVVDKSPPNRLSNEERLRLLNVVNTIEFRDLSPKQIVPRLADRGEYLASESTIYRVLKAEGQLTHRGRSRSARNKRPEEFLATRANQVWSWDITYLKGPVKGSFYYLYLVTDIYSRMIVGFHVHESECPTVAAQLIDRIVKERGVDPKQLVLHSDNGGPMKGATMLATLHFLGVVPSFSRPHVSDDNAFSEAVFKTLKYRPTYPEGRFGSLSDAKTWVEGFVNWYNEEHMHSGIGFVTPSSRYQGKDAAILEARRRVYAQARCENPERWANGIRAWKKSGPVYLNQRGEKGCETTIKATG